MITFDQLVMSVEVLKVDAEKLGFKIPWKLSDDIRWARIDEDFAGLAEARQILVMHLRRFFKNSPELFRANTDLFRHRLHRSLVEKLDAALVNYTAEVAARPDPDTAIAAFQRMQKYLEAVCSAQLEYENRLSEKRHQQAIDRANALAKAREEHRQEALERIKVGDFVREVHCEFSNC